MNEHEDKILFLRHRDSPLTVKERRVVFKGQGRRVFFLEGGHQRCERYFAGKHHTMGAHF